jgi:hypothetical protein
MTARTINFNDLPLFADDQTIGTALLGAQRAKEWSAVAPLYEREGLPKIDRLMGGRYVPAVKAFFDRLYGLVGLSPTAPGGVENPDVWKNRRGR